MKLSGETVVVGNAAPPLVIAQSLKVVVAAVPEPKPPDGVTAMGDAVPVVA